MILSPKVMTHFTSVLAHFWAEGAAIAAGAVAKSDISASAVNRANRCGKRPMVVSSFIIGIFPLYTMKFFLPDDDNQGICPSSCVEPEFITSFCVLSSD